MAAALADFAKEGERAAPWLSEAQLPEHRQYHGYPERDDQYVLKARVHELGFLGVR
jgi:hypothetical protein